MAVDFSSAVYCGASVDGVSFEDVQAAVDAHARDCTVHRVTVDDAGMTVAHTKDE